MSASSYAPAGAFKATAATESRQMVDVRNYFKNKGSAAVLRYCVGLEAFDDAPTLAANTIVICFDTEAWTADPSKVTEVGINTFDRRECRDLDSGTYGVNFLKKVYFYHIRFQRNAHLLNKKFCPGDPEANRFGQTRFLSVLEAQGCLNEAFGWYIDANKKELGYCPVVVVGHALAGDMDKLRLTLGFDPYAHGNIVKVIDTQDMAREVGWWTKYEQVGLERLVGMCGFEYRDAHTASNDAAMTMIAAIQMALPGHLRPNVPLRGDSIHNVVDSVQNVVDSIEAASKNHNWEWGSDKYCIRCGSRDHFTKNDGTGRSCRVSVNCEHCRKAGRKDKARTHRTENCIQYGLGQGNLSRAVAQQAEEDEEVKAASAN